MEIKKSAALLGFALVLTVFASLFVFAQPPSSVTIGEPQFSTAAPWTCPPKTGTCTQGACDEDLGPRQNHACSYACVGGSYAAGVECGTNMCYGAQCQSAVVN
jgi:hypothetical protein